jgi:hypothetical protein
MTFLQKLLEDPVRLARLKRWSYGGLAIVGLADGLLPLILSERESHFSFEDFPAWGSLYGLFSCVAIIVLSKLIGKTWLMRPEDYYDG